MFCDLHMHSTASDGTDAPGLLPALACAAGLAAIALTDHDTTAGIAACAQACDDEGLATARPASAAGSTFVRLHNALHPQPSTEQCSVLGAYWSRLSYNLTSRRRLGPDSRG